MSERMLIPELGPILGRAKAAIQFAQDTRADQRRRRRPDRGASIVTALEQLEDSMSQIRPLVHASTRRPVPREDDLREASRLIQSERRKLRKMLRTTTNRQPVGIDASWV